MIRDFDVLAKVIEVLHDAMPGVTIGDVLPEEHELDQALPCVVLDVLPGEEKSAAWGGEVFPVRLDVVPIDVEVFAKSRAQAAPVARQLRMFMHQLPHIAGTEVTSVVAPEFGTREDLNPRVKVLGVIAELTLHN